MPRPRTCTVPFKMPVLVMTGLQVPSLPFTEYCAMKGAAIGWCGWGGGNEELQTRKIRFGG